MPANVLSADKDKDGFGVHFKQAGDGPAPKKRAPPGKKCHKAVLQEADGKKLPSTTQASIREAVKTWVQNFHIKHPDKQLSLKAKRGQMSDPPDCPVELAMKSSEIVCFGPERGVCFCKACGTYLKSVRGPSDWEKHQTSVSHIEGVMTLAKGENVNLITDEYHKPLLDCEKILALANAQMAADNSTVSYLSAERATALHQCILGQLDKPTGELEVQIGRSKAANEAGAKSLVELESRVRDACKAVVEAIKVCEKYKGPADMSKDELAILERARKANTSLQDAAADSSVKVKVMKNEAKKSEIAGNTLTSNITQLKTAAGAVGDRHYLPWWIRLLAVDAQEGLVSKLLRAKSVFLYVDESTNRKVKSNMVVCASFQDPDTNEFRAVLLEVLDVSAGISGEDLYKKLAAWLRAHGVFNLVKILVTDGASSVFAGRGTVKSLGARYIAARKEEGKENAGTLLYWWCMAHRLSLVLKDALGEMPRGKRLTKFVSVMANFFKDSRSTARVEALASMIKKMETGKKTTKKKKKQGPSSSSSSSSSKDKSGGGTKSNLERCQELAGLLEEAAEVSGEKGMYRMLASYTPIRWGSLIRCCLRLADCWDAIHDVLHGEDSARLCSNAKAEARRVYLKKEMVELKGLVFFLADFSRFFDPAIKDVQRTSDVWVHDAYFVLLRLQMSVVETSFQYETGDAPPQVPPHTKGGCTFEHNGRFYYAVRPTGAAADDETFVAMPVNRDETAEIKKPPMLRTSVREAMFNPEMLTLKELNLTAFSRLASWKEELAPTIAMEKKNEKDQQRKARQDEAEKARVAAAERQRLLAKQRRSGRERKQTEKARALADESKQPKNKGGVGGEGGDGKEEEGKEEEEGSSQAKKDDGSIKDEDLDKLKYSETSTERLDLTMKDINFFMTGFVYSMTTRFPDPDIKTLEAFTILDPKLLIDNETHYHDYIRTLFDKGYNFTKHKEEAVTAACKALVNESLALETADAEEAKKLKNNGDILAYYQLLIQHGNTSIIPFCQFAIAVLPFMPTSVICEASFSQYNSTMRADRSRMDEKNMAAYVILKYAKTRMASFQVPRIKHLLKFVNKEGDRSKQEGNLKKARAACKLKYSKEENAGKTSHAAAHL